MDGKGWFATERVTNALASRLGSNPVGAFTSDEGILLPLRLPHGTHRDTVLDSLVSQAAAIAAHLTAEIPPQA